MTEAIGMLISLFFGGVAYILFGFWQEKEFIKQQIKYIKQQRKQQKEWETAFMKKWESMEGARQMDKEKVNYDMDYSAEQVHRFILHKNNLIDLRQQGNYKATETLIDLEMLEQRYLTNNQRTVIYYVYERGHTLKRTAEILNITKGKVVEILDSILPTLKKYLRSDII